MSVSHGVLLRFTLCYVVLRRYGQAVDTVKNCMNQCANESRHTLNAKYIGIWTVGDVPWEDGLQRVGDTTHDVYLIPGEEWGEEHRGIIGRQHRESGWE